MIVWLWVAFIAFVLVMLALDLGVFNRTAHVVGPREALAWTGVCVALALLFVPVVYYLYQHHALGIGRGAEHIDGRQAAIEFLTGWIIEYSLSLDNIFVIALIFNYFRVPREYEHRVLFWGVLGALLMRGAMIGAGAILIARFSWIIYVFGALLLATAVKMMLAEQDHVEPERNPLVRLARRLYPISTAFEGEHFFTRIDGRLAATPLFLTLLVVESTDVVFAVDSIPAIFAVTRDPFIIFTSNVFAILGLRSLYFGLSALMNRFRYIKVSLVFVLAYVGVKMLLSHHYPIPAPVSLAVIAGGLGIGLAASVMAARRHRPPVA